MTHEFDFLRAAVRQFFQPGSPLPSREGLDWNVVVQLAHRHGVAGFLPAGDDPALVNSTRDAAQSALALSAELVKLAELFRNARIVFIPLKGPVLGVMLYQDRPLKTSTDLDLLVRPEDALRAKRLLESAGYRLESIPHWQSEAAYLRNVNDELSFNDPGLWLKLDLHWRLLPSYFPSSFDEASLWGRAQTIPWAGAELRILSPEQQLMFLCGHGAKHLWARLGWICDLARLIQVEPAIDWNEVFEHARRSHTTRIILLGLLLAEEISGIELPPAAASLLKRDPRARVLADAVLERLPAGPSASTVATAAFCVRALERPSQRARLLFGMFVQPTEAEYRLAQMPPPLYWVYYLLRPLRLTAKYTRRLSGS